MHPPRRHRKTPAHFSKASNRKRHLVENFFEPIKNLCRVTTRDDKLAEAFVGFACLAATLISLFW